MNIEEQIFFLQNMDNNKSFLTQNFANLNNTSEKLLELANLQNIYL